MSLARVRPHRIGISGTGYIARGLSEQLAPMGDRYNVPIALTRRAPDSVAPMPGVHAITADLEQFVESCDIVVECSGSVDGARQVVEAAIAAGRPIVTLNAEFQATIGAAFRDYPMITEAQGDQPGSIAALDEEVRLMGFEPVAYASQKGFLALDPSREDMQFWSGKQGISLGAVTSFTDGTKVQIEQSLVAECLGATIAAPGLLGPKAETLKEGGFALAEAADALGAPISDYVLCPGGRGEIFIVAKHPSPPDQLRYYKLGDGPYYVIERPYHLGHLEIPVTIARMIEGRGPLMRHRRPPETMVVAVAKRAVAAGQHTAQAIGTFDFRGEARLIADCADAVPIGLMEDCVLKNGVEPGQVVTWSDVELSKEASVALWRDMITEDAARRHIVPLTRG
ncbi:MAG: NAD(P)-dependent oxidoreductase [Pseudomonadota bacterium]